MKNILLLGCMLLGSVALSSASQDAQITLVDECYGDYNLKDFDTPISLKVVAPIEFTITTDLNVGFNYVLFLIRNDVYTKVSEGELTSSVPLKLLPYEDYYIDIVDRKTSISLTDINITIQAHEPVDDRDISVSTNSNYTLSANSLSISTVDYVNRE